MATNSMLDAGVLEGRRYRNRHMPMSTAYHRTNFDMAQVVYRAQAIQRLTGTALARAYLMCEGAETSLIDRVIASSPDSVRR